MLTGLLDLMVTRPTAQLTALLLLLLVQTGAGRMHFTMAVSSVHLAPSHGRLLPAKPVLVVMRREAGDDGQAGRGREAVMADKAGVGRQHGGGRVLTSDDQVLCAAGMMLRHQQRLRKQGRLMGRTGRHRMRTDRQTGMMTKQQISRHRLLGVLYTTAANNQRNVQSYRRADPNRA